MNLTLRQIRAFVAVARLGRFNLAADRLHVTQSALSMLVRELEEQLGLRLFDRHTRMVELTAAGREFLPVAEKTIGDLEAAVAATRELATLKRGRVSIAASTVLAATLLPWAISKFRAQHPGIAVALRDVAEQEIRQRVRRGDVDMGVGTSLDPDAELVELPLFEDRLTLLADPSHPLATKANVSWQDLTAHPFIALGHGSPLRALIDRALERAAVRVEPAYEVSFSSTVISMVAAGLGVSVLPVNARQVTPRVRVEVRDLARPTVARQVSLFRQRDVSATPAAETFEHFLRAYVRVGAFTPGAARSRG